MIPPPLILIVEIMQKQRKYNVEVQYESQVAELANELHEALELQDDEECLIFKNSKKLDLHQTFQQQQIQKGDTVQIEIKKKDSQQVQQVQQNQNLEPLKIIPFASILIKVRYLVTDQTFQFEVNNTSLVSDLMGRIHTHLNLAKERNIQLYFNQQLLKPQKTLRIQKVLNNSLIDVQLQEHAGQIQY